MNLPGYRGVFPFKYNMNKEKLHKKLLSTHNTTALKIFKGGMTGAREGF
jgi:hypothetical protein